VLARGAVAALAEAGLLAALTRGLVLRGEAVLAVAIWSGSPVLGPLYEDGYIALVGPRY